MSPFVAGDQKLCLLRNIREDQAQLLQKLSGRLIGVSHGVEKLLFPLQQLIVGKQTLFSCQLVQHVLADGQGCFKVPLPIFVFDHTAGHIGKQVNSLAAFVPLLTEIAQQRSVIFCHGGKPLDSLAKLQVSEQEPPFILTEKHFPDPRRWETGLCQTQGISDRHHQLLSRSAAKKSAVDLNNSSKLTIQNTLLMSRIGSYRTLRCICVPTAQVGNDFLTVGPLPKLAPVKNAFKQLGGLTQSLE